MQLSIPAEPAGRLPPIPVPPRDASYGNSSEWPGRLFEASREYLQGILNAQLAGPGLSPPLRKELSVCDLVQETFLAAHRSFPTLRGRTPGEVRAWLRAVLLGRLASAFRRALAKKRDPRQDVSLELHTRDRKTGRERQHQLVAKTPSPPEQVLLREQIDHLKASLRRLPERYRQVIGLRSQEGWDFADIGRFLNTSAEGARKLWARALEKLRREMKGFL